jgi:hypothetical protein
VVEGRGQRAATEESLRVAGATCPVQCLSKRMERNPWTNGLSSRSYRAIVVSTSNPSMRIKGQVGRRIWHHGRKHQTHSAFMPTQVHLYLPPFCDACMKYRRPNAAASAMDTCCRNPIANSATGASRRRQVQVAAVGVLFSCAPALAKISTVFSRNPMASRQGCLCDRATAGEVPKDLEPTTVLEKHGVHAPRLVPLLG